MVKSELVDESFFETARGVSFDQDTPVLERVNIIWFLPFTPVEDRWRAQIFVNEWLVFGSHQNDFGCGWQARVQHLIGDGQLENEVGARIVASMFRWFGTNIGFSFIEELVKELDLSREQNIPFSRENTRTALAKWWCYVSCTPSGNYHLGYLLTKILGVQGRFCTFDELNMAQRVIIFISKDEGLQFLLKVLKKIESQEKSQAAKLKI